MKNMKKKGFTVVELVIVIAIVAILAAVLIPTFASLIKKANDSAYLQDRTNQQIADLVEKVEDQEFLTWEEFEAELAKQLANNATSEQVANSTELTKAAIAEAVAKFELAVKNNSTSLTEDQVKTIVEKALSNSLTTAQVESIVNAAVAKIELPTSLTNTEVKQIVDSAIAAIKIPAAGATAADITSAVSGVLTKVDGLETLIKNANANAVDEASIKATIDTAIQAALAGIKLPEAGKTLSADEVKAIVDASLKNLKVLTEAEVSNIVNTAVDGAVATLKNNVGDTGITRAEMQAAIEDALKRVNVEVIGPGYIGGTGVDYTAIQAAVTNALNAFGVVTEDELDEAIKEAMGTAKKRADEIAADEMNAIVKGIADFEVAVAALDAAGYNVSKLTPIRTGYLFCWDDTNKEIKCVLESAIGSYVDILDEGASLIEAEVNNASDLKEALERGNDITLTSNITNAQEIIIPAGADVTLDLGGFSYTTDMTNAGKQSQTSKYIKLSAGATLTIQNGTFSGRGIMNNGGTLVIKAGTVINAVDVNGGACIKNKTGGTVVIEGGTFVVPNYIKWDTVNLGGAGVVENNGGIVTIKDGTFFTNTESYAICNLAGTMTIEGGTFKSYRGVIACEGGEVIVNGGTFTRDVSPTGNYSSGHHIYCPAGTVTVGAAAVFNGTHAYSQYVAGTGSIIKN